MEEKTTTASFTSDTKDIETQITENVVPFEKSAAEKKLVRKINWTLMPFVCVILFIQVKKIKIITITSFIY
jgi:hypothetical protein